MDNFVIAFHEIQRSKTQSCLKNGYLKLLGS